jgi:hypothetical protein
MIRIISLMALWLSIRSTVYADAPTATLIEVKRIWDQAPHNAFTDLTYWNSQFVCAFREGRGHVSADGKIRILTSGDGRTWSSAAVVSLDGFDLRDAGLCATPDGRLMLVGGAAPRKSDNEDAPTGAFVAFSLDGKNWRVTVAVPPGRWMWRVAWNGGRAYGISYAAPAGHPFTSLLVSDDGVKFRELVSKLNGDGYPTEAVLRFENDSNILYCLQRRDGAAPKNSALLGISRSPYTDWRWHDLKIYFGGPNFIQIPDRRWIAAGRIIHPDAHKTALAWLDVEKKELTPILTLPSGGDTSYPGLVWHDGLLWVSYYSSHEGKTSIYLAKVAIPFDDADSPAAE